MKKVVLLLSILIAQSLFAQVKPLKEVNTNLDEKSGAFRFSPQGLEFWFTRTDANSRETKLKFINLDEDKNKIQDASKLVNFSSNKFNIAQNGSPSFPFCGDYGFISSNRLYNGSNYDNDLYQLNFGNNSPGVSRLNTGVNGDFYENSPHITFDGQLLYFSSDRGSKRGVTKIYMSKKRGDAWSEPVKLNITGNFEASEQTPFVGPDSHLYFSSNDTDNKNYDLFKIEIDKSNGLPKEGASPQKIEIEGVNTDESNEFFPVISPSGAWFIFTSDRGEDEVNDFDLYYHGIEIDEVGINVSINLKTRTYNELTRVYEDAIEPLKTSVNLIDLNNGKQFDLQSDPQGNLSTSLVMNTSDHPFNETIFKSFSIKAKSPDDQKFFSPRDTIVVRTNCKAQIEHILTLTDMQIYQNPNCIQEFPVKGVKFFITGYWCPTTQEFLRYTQDICQSPLEQNTCLEIEYEKPELPCDENEFYKYSLDFEEPEVRRERQMGRCIDLKEARLNGDEYSAAVDAAIVEFIEIMKNGLNEFCVEKAVNNNKEIKIIVKGFTDIRPLSKDCRYTGSDIDFKNSEIHLEGLDSKTERYLEDGILKYGQRFRESRIAGNEMLADLRAYYTAQMLNKVWYEEVEDFKKIKDKGLLKVYAEGRGIDPRTVNNKLEEQRKVSVSIEVPMTEGEKLTTFKPAKGKVVWKCESVPCGELKFEDYSFIFKKRESSIVKK